MRHLWYQDFFSGVVVDMWRSASEPGQTRAEVDFLEAQLHLLPGQRVLDVPCGFGRHSVELARRGYRMTGVDISADMLAEAHKLAAAHECRIEWRQGEMRVLPPAVAYDAAFCFGNSFGYLDRDGMAGFLAAVSSALPSGARFALDYGTSAESILPRFVERDWSPVDGLYFLESNRYDPAASCIETTYTFVRDGVSDTRTGCQWVYTVGEVRAMLEQAGFAMVGMHGAVDGRPFTLGAPLLIMVAERR